MTHKEILDRLEGVEMALKADGIFYTSSAVYNAVLGLRNRIVSEIPHQCGSCGETHPQLWVGGNCPGPH